MTAGTEDGPGTVEDEAGRAEHEPEAGAEDADVAPGGESTPRGRSVGRWIAVGAAVLVVGGYVGAAAYAADRIPAGTQVLGVGIGGLDRDAAVAALAPAVEETVSTPVELAVADRATTIDPGRSGLGIDAEATVDGLVGFSLAPTDVMRAFSGATLEVEPVTTVDRDALAGAVEQIAEPLVTGAVDAMVTVSATGASVTPGEDGMGVDVDATVEIVAQQWPADAVEAATAPVEPAITTTAAEEFAAELNAVTLAGDVAMTGENGDATVTSRQIVDNASVEAVDGELTLVVDGGPIAVALERDHPELVSEAEGASFRFTSDHRLETQESTPGREIDPDALGDAVVAAATSADRVGTLPYRDFDADVTSDELGVSDFKEIVSSFSTPVPYNPTRTRNLARGAELITGTVIKPGERFDLTEVLSPIDGTNGYHQAGVIVNGLHTEAYGGGLSQVSTTTYNAGYFAGMEDIAHRPHSVWFSRYPAGRESTLYLGSINMVWENVTPYALVMNAYIHDAELTVEIWSTPHFTVETRASERTNVRPITTVEVDDPECEDYPGGEPGFTITNTREVYLGDELVDTTSETWTYRPDNAVRCV